VAAFFLLTILLGSLGLLQAPATAEGQAGTDNVQPMVLSACGKQGSHLRRVGWGKYGLQFDVPVNEARISGGKPDVDYVRYVIKPMNGDGYLELWFGPMAFSPEPDKELLLNSVRVQKRKVVNVTGEEIGQDSSGKLKTGKIWRHTFFLVGGADGTQYESVQENVELFNRIVDSACFVSPPRT
jgi:hypothetical protein